MEECRELARHAVDQEDRAFWQHAAARWEDQLRAMQANAPAKKAAPEHMRRIPIKNGTRS
jgi:hypothetical protein